MDSLSALNVFVCAAEIRSFTDAGRQLGLSSSAVGKAIARLEERLGVRLFHRSTRSITLTHEGTLFLESCRRIFSEVRAVEQEFAQSTNTPKGKLRVSLPLIGTLITSALGRFMREYPEIELDLDFADHPVDVIAGGYDIAIRAGEVSDSRLMSRRLGTYQLQIVASPAYLKKSGLPIRPADLMTHACLHHRSPVTGKLEPWPLICSSNADGIDLPTTATASTYEPLIAMAETGLGLACVPDFTVQRALASGALISVLEGHINHSDSFRALWPSNRYLTRKVRVFIDFLAENLFPETCTQVSEAVRSSAVITGPTVSNARSDSRTCQVN